jgi:hypothetical protein
MCKVTAIHQKLPARAALDGRKSPASPQPAQNACETLLGSTAQLLPTFCKTGEKEALPSEGQSTTRQAAEVVPSGLSATRMWMPQPNANFWKPSTFRTPSASINSDLHWNPVKLMQRTGLVDRRMNPDIEQALSAQ